MADDTTLDWGELPNIKQQTTAYLVRGMRMFWHLTSRYPSSRTLWTLE